MVILSRSNGSRGSFWGLVEQKGPWKTTPTDQERSHYPTPNKKAGGGIQIGGTENAGHAGWYASINPKLDGTIAPSMPNPSRYTQSSIIVKSSLMPKTAAGSIIRNSETSSIRNDSPSVQKPGQTSVQHFYQSEVETPRSENPSLMGETESIPTNQTNSENQGESLYFSQDEQSPLHQDATAADIPRVQESGLTVDPRSQTPTSATSAIDLADPSSAGFSGPMEYPPEAFAPSPQFPNVPQRSPIDFPTAPEYLPTLPDSPMVDYPMSPYVPPPIPVQQHPDYELLREHHNFQQFGQQHQQQQQEYYQQLLYGQAQQRAQDHLQNSRQRLDQQQAQRRGLHQTPNVAPFVEMNNDDDLYQTSVTGSRQQSSAFRRVPDKPVTPFVKPDDEPIRARPVIHKGKGPVIRPPVLNVPVKSESKSDVSMKSSPRSARVKSESITPRSVKMESPGSMVSVKMESPRAVKMESIDGRTNESPSIVSTRGSRSRAPLSIQIPNSNRIDSAIAVTPPPRAGPGPGPGRLNGRPPMPRPNTAKPPTPQTPSPASVKSTPNYIRNVPVQTPRSPRPGPTKFQRPNPPSPIDISTPTTDSPSVGTRRKPKTPKTPSPASSGSFVPGRAPSQDSNSTTSTPPPPRVQRPRGARKPPIVESSTSSGSKSSKSSSSKSSKSSKVTSSSSGNDRSSDSNYQPSSSTNSSQPPVNNKRKRTESTAVESKRQDTTSTVKRQNLERVVQKLSNESDTLFNNMTALRKDPKKKHLVKEALAKYQAKQAQLKTAKGLLSRL